MKMCPRKEKADEGWHSFFRSSTWELEAEYYSKGMCRHRPAILILSSFAVQLGGCYSNTVYFLEVEPKH